MRQKQLQLERRRRSLRAKAAAQRLVFEQQMGALRGPAAVFDKARQVGILVRQNAPLLAFAGSLAMLLLRGRPIWSVAGSGWRLGRRAMRTLTLFKIATAFLRRHPGRARWHGSAA